MKEKLEESLEDVDVSFEVERKSEAGIAKNIISDDDGDDDSESYVPDSLREFFKAADRQLEDDLAFLSPPEPGANQSYVQKDDVVLGGYVEEENVNPMTAEDENDNNDLEKEMEKARQKDLERAAAMQKEQEDRKEREKKQLDQHDLQEEQRKEKQRKLEAAAKVEAAKALEDEEDSDDDEDSSLGLGVVNPAEDLSKNQLKEIAMEGADHSTEMEVEDLKPLVATSPLPSPTIDTDMAALANGEQGFSPSPNKVGRKLQMELDAEAQRADMQESDKNNTSADSVKMALQEKQESIRSKQERLKELQARNAERKQRLKALEDEAAERDSVEVVLVKGSPSRLVKPHELRLDDAEEAAPSTADVIAASKAAAVAVNSDVAANVTEKEPTVPKPKPKKASLTGPVRSLPTHRRKPVVSNTNQKWSFRARDAPSPPRPVEIITHTTFSEDARSVSPLAHEQPMSPLASPEKQLRKPQARRPVRKSDTNNNNSKPQRSSPSRRRQLTRPNSAFDRLSRPTVSSRTNKAADTRQQTKVNPEVEQRKARERVRKRMAAQRKAKSGTDAVVTKKALEKKERKEKIERMEQERLAKIKAKIAEREQRIQAKKKEEAKKTKPKQKTTTTTTTLPQKAQKKASRPRKSSSGLTIPVAPKFATDRRMSVTSKRAPPKERLSLASSASMFGKGLRSSTPPVKRSATPEPRRLTIPMAPKFSTSKRLGEKQPKSTPFSSPGRKGRDNSDNVSWSSQLRDVSAIGSPLSKAANSVKTGPLTIPITPQFQPIRKRPLPKSTAEREKEEMQYFKEHPFKARMVKMHEPLTSSRAKKPTPKRKLTTPEPFHFNSTTRSTHKRGHVEAKEEVTVKTFKASPAPNFSLKKTTKKTPHQARPHTTPEPFQFNTSSKRSHVTSEEKPSAEKFKALPMPDFKKSNRTSLGSSKLISPRSITTPEPFKFNSTVSSKRSHSKSEEESTEAQFKALPMPDFKKSSGSKKLKSPPTRPLTTPEPFKLTENRTREITNSEESQPFKARPMPNFSKSPPLVEQQKARTKSSRSTGRPTGASGLLFHRSFTATSRLSRPKVTKALPTEESKPFKARPMLDFIPDVIITRTPIKDEEESNRDKSAHELEPHLDDEVSGILSDTNQFQARPMPDFNKIDIPVKEKLPHSIRSASPSSRKENEMISPAFKASPAPKNMLDEPKIPVRRRDPSKLRSPESVKRPDTAQSKVGSPVFKARPVPDSIYDEPSPARRSRGSPIRKIKSPDRSFVSEDVSDAGNNVMEDAKARLRERLSKRRTNSAAVKAATPNRDNDKSKAKAKKTTPKAFSTLHVQSRLNSQANNTKNEQVIKKLSGTENTPRKSNSAAPRSIEASLVKSIPDAVEQNPTPKATNSTVSPSSFHTAEAEEAAFGSNPADLRGPPALDKDATKLAEALGLPDEDESSSILKLARDVARAAEDELSFYGSVDTRDHWSSSLADGRPHSLFDNNAL